MTPQGLSKIIKNMENELDCTLIDRSPQGIRLTESGECFLHHSFSVTAEYGSLKKELLNIRQRNHGIVDLLSSYGILRLVTPDCIMAFQKRYPGNPVFLPGIPGSSDRAPVSGEEWKICMLTRRGEPVSEAVTLFCNHVMDWMREIKLGHLSR